MPVLDSLSGIGQPSGSQVDASNPFTLDDIFDFRYIPDPALSQQARYDNFTLRSHPSVDIDALIGPVIPGAFDNTVPSGPMDNNLQIDGNENALHATTLGSSADAIDSSRSYCPQITSQVPNSNIDSFCNSRVQYPITRRGAEGGNHNNLQREELLGTISRLVELAASM